MGAPGLFGVCKPLLAFSLHNIHFGTQAPFPSYLRQLVLNSNVRSKLLLEKKDEEPNPWKEVTLTLTYLMAGSGI